MSERLEVSFHPSLPEHAQRLLAALDVDIRLDETAPKRCECEGCRAYRRETAGSRRVQHVRRLVRAGICPMHEVTQPCMICWEQGIEP